MFRETSFVHESTVHILGNIFLLSCKATIWNNIMEEHNEREDNFNRTVRFNVGNGAERKLLEVEIVR